MSSIFKRKVGDSSASDSSYSDVHLVPFIIGIILITVGLVDMIVLFLVPYFKIQNAKKQYPNETFEKPSILIIVIHFILHALLILFGIILILISLNISLPKEKYWITIPFILIIIGWAVEMAVSFALTKYPKSQMIIDDLLTNLHNEHPSNLIFIYTHYIYEKTSCSRSKKKNCTTTTYHCYSKKGVSIPIQTKLIQNKFDFTKAPGMFYIEVGQNVNMTTSLANYLREYLAAVNKCDSYHKEIEFHPIITGNFIVSSKKVPVGLSKQTRMASIILGVGVYYELYTKSIPHINYVQRFSADVVESNDYERPLMLFSCKDYGSCSTSNKRPTP